MRAPRNILAFKLFSKEGPRSIQSELFSRSPDASRRQLSMATVNLLSRFAHLYLDVFCTLLPSVEAEAAMVLCFSFKEFRARSDCVFRSIAYASNGMSRRFGYAQKV